MRLTTGVVLWAVSAAAATAVGLAAVAAIGTDIFGAGQEPLSQSEVDELLASRTRPPTTTPAATPSTSTSVPPSSTPTPSASPEQPTATAGGTVIARCTPEGLVEVLSASPAQGYQVDTDDEIEDHPSVKFSGPQEIEVRLRCTNGVPVARVEYDD